MTTFILKGRWSGEPHDEHRRFEGHVEQTGVLNLHPGDPVVVTFVQGKPTLEGQASSQRGHYKLEGMPTAFFVLTSFTRKDGVMGHEAEWDDPAQVWGGEVFSSQ
ncbi:hypothetical protein [Deinococcus peraridilitoris]|uniref:Uncharacterized protein n=1 Tax=Deinococcus peraridilitoris (strain DSM 19664 / LMG 22246 / CIP 109416 / KR-200) TaxID=937777 RepID=K9ZZG4_DEIPD|nr:hypothetical protein [Deinococcus peraridilitoris]AFZ67038.1 hypothetical protein Deipe_1497 [Deinococcus peraridilitoris DSM 19664]